MKGIPPLVKHLFPLRLRFGICPSPAGEGQIPTAKLPALLQIGSAGSFAGISDLDHFTGGSRQVYFSSPIISLKSAHA